MSFKTFLSLGALSALARFVFADTASQQLTACKDGSCVNGCDYKFNVDLGYPECIVYSYYDFQGSGYPPSDNGGVDVFWDVPNPDEGCAYILRTPAYTDRPGCGINVLSVRNPSCNRVNIQQTFAVQYCCGTDDCNAAGAGLGKRDGGASGMRMYYANGTAIAPLASYPAPVDAPVKREPAALSRMGAPLTKRDCVFNPSNGPYTFPGDTQVVDPNIQNGPASVEISSSVSVGYTTTIEAGLSFEVFSAGFSFSIEETVTESLSYTYQVQDGQSGVVTWTPILTCYDGATTGCSAEDNQEGQFCYATRSSDGQPVGQYSLQVRS